MECWDRERQQLPEKVAWHHLEDGEYMLRLPTILLVIVHINIRNIEPEYGNYVYYNQNWIQMYIKIRINKFFIINTINARFQDRSISSNQ